jgi:hypothetical protein
MRFTGQGRHRGRYLTQPGTGVGARHRKGTMSGEYLRHCEAGMTFDGCDGSVTQDMGGYRRALRPRQAWPGPIEDGVVAPARYRSSASASQDSVIADRRTSAGRVIRKSQQERRRHRLFSLGAELLPEPDSEASMIQAADREIERTLSTGT